jgi:hypothetical protein
VRFSMVNTYCSAMRGLVGLDRGASVRKVD